MYTAILSEPQQHSNITWTKPGLEGPLSDDDTIVPFPFLVRLTDAAVYHIWHCTSVAMRDGGPKISDKMEKCTPVECPQVAQCYCHHHHHVITSLLRRRSHNMIVIFFTLCLFMLTAMHDLWYSVCGCVQQLFRLGRDRIGALSMCHRVCRWYLTLWAVVASPEMVCHPSALVLPGHRSILPRVSIVANKPKPDTGPVYCKVSMLNYYLNTMS